MAYESKIYVVSRPENKERVYGRIIAMYDCACMGYGISWDKLIKENVKYDIYIENGDIPTKEDMYGDTLQEISIDKAIEWIEEEIKALESKNDYYRRLPPLLALLKGFNPRDWDGDLYVVHYGY